MTRLIHATQKVGTQHREKKILHIGTRFPAVKRRRKNGPLLFNELGAQELLGDGGEGEHVNAVYVLDVVAEPECRRYCARPSPNVSYFVY